jgi:hypothetical protein
MAKNDKALPNRGKRHLLIAVSDVDQVFSDAVINELANTLKLKTLEGDGSRRFAQSIRHDARLFIEAKARLNYPQLRREIERLDTLNNRAMRGDREAQQLARAVDAMPAEVRDWLARCNPEGRNIPTIPEIASPATRASAVLRLRLILSYGGVETEGRKRPTGKRSWSFKPLLRVPEGIKHKSKRKEGRPRGEVEREFVRNLGITYLNAMGKRPPYKVDFQGRGPFSEFVHRCFELAGAPHGYVTRLINELGQARRKAAGGKPEYPEDLGAYLDERERFYRERWEAEAQIDGLPIRNEGKRGRK